MATEKDLLYRAKFVDDVTPGLTALAQKINEMTAAFSLAIPQITPVPKGLDAITDAAAKVVPKIDATTKVVQEATTAIKEVGGATREASTHTSNSSMSWLALTSKVYLAQQAFQAIYGPMMAVVEAAKQYDSVRARLTATEGNALVADKDLKNLQELAKLPGLGFGEASQSLAALRSLRVGAQEAFGIIEGMAKANANMGGGAEQFGRVMYQIQQSIGMGKLMGEDMRSIKEAIPNLGVIIEQTFGTMDNEKINKKLESMGKSTKDFWEEIAKAAEKLPPAGETIQNNMDNLGDAWTRLKASLADTSAIKSATGWLASFIEKMAQAREKKTQEQALIKEAAQELGLTLSERGDGSFGAATRNMDEGQREALSRMMVTVQARHELEIREAERAKKEIEDKQNAAAAERRLAEVREENAKKHAGEMAKIRKFEIESSQNVDENGNLREGRGFGEEGSRREAAANRERAERADRRRAEEEAKFTAKAAENSAQIQLKWIGTIEEARRKEHDEHVKQITKEADLVQGYAARELSTALQGKMTMKQLEEDATSFLADQVAERTTKWIEQQILQMIFSKTAAAEATAASVAEASTVGAAWAGPSMEASIGTFGAAAGMGSAAWFTAMAAGQTFGAIPGHANGGFEMGNRFMAGERGAEMVRSVVPTQITQASHTTYNQGGNTIHVHIHGGDQSTILRTIRKATTNGSQVSRS